MYSSGRFSRSHAKCASGKLLTHGQPVIRDTSATVRPANEAGGFCSARRSIQLMVFMSPSAASSRNVRNEINLAHSEGRNILVIFLRETRLSEGMKLQIGTVQHLNRFDMTEREFLDKLARVLGSDLRN